MVSRNNLFNRSCQSMTSLFSNSMSPAKDSSSSLPPRGNSQSKPPLRALYDLLIAPMEGGLMHSSGPVGRHRQLVLVLEGELYLIPWALLKGSSSNEYLYERFSLIAVPSIGALGASAKAHPRRAGPVLCGGGSTAAVVGNPRLPASVMDRWLWGPMPSAQEEALMVSELLGCPALAGAAATKERVMGALTQAECAHFATHISWKLAALEFLLTAADILDLRLPVKLVVLGSYQESNSKVTADGVVGLTRAFLAAGAQCVLVSLWPVPVAASKVFVHAFYSALLSGTKASAALADAMKTVQSSKQFSHPSNWAGFMLIGSDVKLNSPSSLIGQALAEILQYPEKARDALRVLLHLVEKSLQRIQGGSVTPCTRPSRAWRTKPAPPALQALCKLIAASETGEQLINRLHQVLVQLQTGEKEQDFSLAPIQVSISVQLWRQPGCHEFLAALGFDLCEVGQEEVVLKTGKQASRRTVHFALQSLLALFDSTELPKRLSLDSSSSLESLASAQSVSNQLPLGYPAPPFSPPCPDGLASDAVSVYSLSSVASSMSFASKSESASDFLAQRQRGGAGPSAPPPAGSRARPAGGAGYGASVSSRGSVSTPTSPVKGSLVPSTNSPFQKVAGKVSSSDTGESDQSSTETDSTVKSQEDQAAPAPLDPQELAQKILEETQSHLRARVQPTQQQRQPEGAAVALPTPPKPPSRTSSLQKISSGYNSPATSDTSLKEGGHPSPTPTLDGLAQVKLKYPSSPYSGHISRSPSNVSPSSGHQSPSGSASPPCPTPPRALPAPARPTPDLDRLKRAAIDEKVQAIHNLKTFWANAAAQQPPSGPCGPLRGKGARPPGRPQPAQPVPRHSKPGQPEGRGTWAPAAPQRPPPPAGPAQDGPLPHRRPQRRQPRSPHHPAPRGTATSSSPPAGSSPPRNAEAFGDTPATPLWGWAAFRRLLPSPT
ncbi:hypothetical protein ANANG_G00186780 [Anguilla anguilla]|uniref:CHAT domain-containing protein n=1 Tax=Anguilla anguilla TaxID=7936 RepID=A0A9D3M1N3_ANGAN|nr:hypothetical protein ANANG_G00186780 [Anguilla anguilla]